MMMTTLGLLLLATQSPDSGPIVTDHTTPYESVTESARLYREQDARTISGVIEDTHTVLLNDGVPFMQMDVKTDHGIIAVHLAPVWYMEEHSHLFDVNRGRSVTVLGNNTDVQGREVFVAAELTNNDQQQHIRLRHPSGVPAWVGSERVR